MRLFFAIELPDPVRTSLAGLRPAESGEYRWVQPSLLHVTLAFLGQQPEERLETLEQVGAAAAKASQAAILKLGRGGSFGPRREPRVLWIGLDGDVGTLLVLQARLASGLREAGFDLEDRPFSPHVTLARRRDSTRSVHPPAWPPVANVPSQAFTVDHLTLIESRLSPGGPTYIRRVEFPLGRSV